MANETIEPVGKMAAPGRWIKTNRIWIPELDDGVRIRVTRLKQDLDLEKRAADDGRLNQPDRSAKTLSQIEMDICARVFSGILILNQFLAEQVGVALKSVRAAIRPAPDIENIKGQISAEIDRVFNEELPYLVEMRKKDLAAHRNLRYFRRKNEITRSAHYKDSKLLLIGTLMAMFVVESFVNGTLFAQIVTTGLIGGAALAGMISAINIATGIVGGLYGWRNIGHKLVPLKLLGVAITIAMHGIALFWNLFVAHFREVAEALAANDNFNFDLSQVGGQTMAHIHAQGLYGIESIQSWALLILGVIIHFLSAKEGWEDVADRYPDYKKYDLSARHAREAFEDGLSVLRENAREAVEAVEAEIKSALGRAREVDQLSSDLLSLAQQREQEVRDSEDEWVSGGTQLLKMYREVNTEIRDEGSAPKYFSHYPTAGDYRNRGYGGAGASVEVQDQTRSAKEAIAELAAAKETAAACVDQIEKLLKEITRHISLGIKDVDKRIDDETTRITHVVEAQLNEMEPDQAAVQKGVPAPQTV